LFASSVTVTWEVITKDFDDDLFLAWNLFQGYSVSRLIIYCTFSRKVTCEDGYYRLSAIDILLVHGTCYVQ
jgi:hypothetical protein